MSADRPGQRDTRLRGRWLVLARVLWIAVFILMLVVFCANLMVGGYGLVNTIVLIADISVWFAVSLVLFWRKSADRAILLISLLLVLTGGFFVGVPIALGVLPHSPVALGNYGAWWVPIDFLGLLAGITLTFAYTFPDGRFVPGFTRWIALGWIVVSLLPIPIPGGFYPWNWWSSGFYTLMRIAFYCSIALALLYRYRRMSTPVQRQQIKWVVFAATIVIVDVSLANLVAHVLPSYFPALSISIQFHQLISTIAIHFFPVLIPLSIGIALLRYQLWDIDLIINRTLVYGALTGMLALVYFLLIIVLQFLVRSLTGNVGQSALAIVASTLVIAALFEPLRHRIQSFVDRRFYRRKYNAARLLAAFNATLRNEVDLNQLSEQIVAVVQETMQPACVSLWLRPPEHNRLPEEPILLFPLRKDEEVKGGL